MAGTGGGGHIRMHQLTNLLGPGPYRDFAAVVDQVDDRADGILLQVA